MDTEVEKSEIRNTIQDAQNYYQEKSVNLILESLVTGLTYSRPEDPLAYIEKGLSQIKTDGVDKLRWDSFLPAKETNLKREIPSKASNYKIGEHVKTSSHPFRGGLISPTNGTQSLLAQISSLSRPSLTNREVLPPIQSDEVKPQPQEETIRNSLGQRPLPQISSTSMDTFETTFKAGNQWNNVVFVLGGPGSGKGTQCVRLAKEFNYCHLSVGDLLRNEVSTGSQIGQQLAELMKEGKIVPMNVTLRLLNNAMENAPNTVSGFLIDGFPRELAQAEAFEQNIAKCKFVLSFDCPESVLQERLLKRGETSGRADDNHETIQKRFQTFTETSLPVIQQYEKYGKCVRISTIPPADEVYDNVKQFFIPLEERNKAWKNIVFAVGGPGTDKKNQCAQVAKAFNHVHISYGDLLVNKASRALTDGKEIEQLMREDQDIPTATALSLLREELNKVSNLANGVIIDGFPRNLEQAAAFESIVAPCRFLLQFDCSKEFMEQRSIPQDLQDPEKEVIQSRIASFVENTSPLVSQYQSNAKCVKINAEEPTDRVFEQLSQVFIDPSQRGPAWNNIVMVLGGPGSGKGTQCERIAVEFNYAHLSSGDLLRAEVAKGTPLGQELEEIMKEGKMVSLDITLGLLKNAMINTPSSFNGFLIDGFPRELNQAQAFESLVAPCKFVLFFDCPEEELVQRLLKRGETSGRADDNIDTIRKRLTTFNEKSYPVAEAYERSGKLVRIMSNAPVEEVYQKTREYFVNLKDRPDSWKNIIFVLGGPGSGKGTACERLVADFHFTHLSTGDLLRAEIQKGSDMGVYLENIMKEGKMVPLHITLDLLRNAMINSPSDSPGFLIDGFPRELTQARCFENVIAPCRFTLFFDCPESVLVGRLVKRGETSGRADDNIETIKKRLQTFTNASLPVVTYYDNIGKCVRISSLGSPEQVYEETKLTFMDYSTLGESWKNIVFVIGAPGTGKGQQCARIASEFNYTHISIGELLRQEVATGSDKGMAIDQILRTGRFVPMEIVLPMLRKAMLDAPPATTGFVLEGFPRELRQARLFETVITDCKFVLVFECPEQYLEERLIKRGKTSDRVDDNPDVIKTRLRIYNEKTAPVIEFYKHLAKCSIVSSPTTSDEVFESIKTLFSENDAHAAQEHAESGHEQSAPADEPRLSESTRKSQANLNESQAPLIPKASQENLNSEIRSSTTQLNGSARNSQAQKQPENLSQQASKKSMQNLHQEGSRTSIAQAPVRKSTEQLLDSTKKSTEQLVQQESKKSIGQLSQHASKKSLGQLSQHASKKSIEQSADSQPTQEPAEQAPEAGKLSQQASKKSMEQLVQQESRKSIGQLSQHASKKFMGQLDQQQSNKDVLERKQSTEQLNAQNPVEETPAEAPAQSEDSNAQ